MKAISNRPRHPSIMHIESKLSRSAVRRLDRAAGVVRHREFTGESHSSNITTMRKIGVICAFD